VRATWSLSFSAWIIWTVYALQWSILSSTSCTIERGICNYKQAARIDLGRLCWNASLMRLTFSSEVCVFPDFTHNRLPVVLSLLSQNWILFHIGGWHSYCILKQRWSAIRDCNFASHNTHWTCFVLTLLLSLPKATSWYLRISWAWKRVFLSNDINRIHV
jgi:hypothetical protein